MTSIAFSYGVFSWRRELELWSLWSIKFNPWNEYRLFRHFHKQTKELFYHRQISQDTVGFEFETCFTMYYENINIHVKKKNIKWFSHKTRLQRIRVQLFLMPLTHSCGLWHGSWAPEHRPPPTDGLQSGSIPAVRFPVRMTASTLPFFFFLHVNPIRINFQCETPGKQLLRTSLCVWATKFLFMLGQRTYSFLGRTSVFNLI